MTLEDQLRRLDPAGDLSGELSRSPRAAATLARVTGTEPGGRRRSGRGVRRKRTVRYGLAAAAAATGVVVAPILGTGSAAFAAWSAEARVATPEEAATAAKYCLDLVGGDVDGQQHDYQAKVVEIRGPWSFAYLLAPDGYEAQCLVPKRPGKDAGGQAMTAPLNGTPAANGLVTNSVMYDEQDNLYSVSGKIGSDVTAVAFHAESTEVQATVKDGYFAAWWPERKPASLLGRLTQQGPPNPDVTITLRDGSTRVVSIQDFDISPL